MAGKHTEEHVHTDEQVHSDKRDRLDEQARIDDQARSDGHTHEGDHAHADDHVVHDHHGQSVAAWAAVGILLVAAFVIALSFPLSNTPLLIIGLVLAVAGVVVGKVLSATGYGVGGKGEITDIADAPDVSNRDNVGIS
jgi:hypothetical protein